MYDFIIRLLTNFSDEYSISYQHTLYCTYIILHTVSKNTVFSLNYCKNIYICWIDKRRTIIPERIFISLKTEGKYFFIARLYR